MPPLVRPVDQRSRIIEAASRCLAELGLENTSITAIAKAAGTSRQTVYKYFATREDVVGHAIEFAAAQASGRIMAAARRQTTAADFAVETCLACVQEFTHNPAIAPLFDLLDTPDRRSQVLSAEYLALSRHYLEPLLDYLPAGEWDLDEMTETFVRFELSLMLLGSERTATTDGLRAYLHAVLVPALGLTGH